MIYALYKYGLWAGIALISLALSWDLLTKGFDCLFVFWKYSISWRGSLCILAGLILILLSIWAKGKYIIGYMYNWANMPDGKLK